MKVGSTKQCKDPESNKALKIIKRDISEVVTERYKVSDSKGAAALSLTSFGTQLRSTQPLVRVESERLLFIFSSLQRSCCRTSSRICPLQSGLLVLRRRRKMSDIPLQCALPLCKKNISCLRNESCRLSPTVS